MARANKNKNFRVSEIKKNSGESTSAKKKVEAKEKIKKDRRRRRNKQLRRMYKNRHKRLWRPFCKLSFKQRQKLEEKMTRKALRTYNQRVNIAMPRAPSNTTQFLMDDRYEQEGKFQSSSGRLKYSVMEYEPVSVAEYAKRDFEKVFNDHLSKMTNSQLISRYLALEDQIETMGKVLQRARLRNMAKPLAAATRGITCENEKIRIYLQEIARVKRANEKLERENHVLSLCLFSSKPNT